MILALPPRAYVQASETRARGASVTELPYAWHGGGEVAHNQVFKAAYAELRAIAGSYLRRRRCGSIQVTGLVHGALLRLVGTKARWADRSHFYGVAAQAMRRILVDHDASMWRRASVRQVCSSQVPQSRCEGALAG